MSDTPVDPPSPPPAVEPSADPPPKTHLMFWMSPSMFLFVAAVALLYYACRST